MTETVSCYPDYERILTLATCWKHAWRITGLGERLHRGPSTCQIWVHKLSRLVLQSSKVGADSRRMCVFSCSVQVVAWIRCARRWQHQGQADRRHVCFRLSTNTDRIRCKHAPRMCMIGINDATDVREKLSYSTLDSLFEALQDMTRRTEAKTSGMARHVHTSSMNSRAYRNLWRCSRQTLTLHTGAYQCGQVCGHNR